MIDLDDFILVKEYDEETFVITPKNPDEVVPIPNRYKVISISFKNKNLLVQRISMTTIEELEILFPEPKK